MKEGYLQTKIAELNTRCQKIEQKLSLEQTTLELLQERVGGFKELLKKLKNIQEFKEEMAIQIKEENEEIIKDQIDRVSNKSAKNIDKILDQKSKQINEALDFLEKREKLLSELKNDITNASNEIEYIIKFKEILMMKLVNKGILSDQEVDEVHRRALKKA